MTNVKHISQALIARFADIVGAANAILRPEDQVTYLREWRDRFFGRTPVVLRPGSTEEVSRILALADAERIGIVPQAGNTGLVGGQIPSERGDEIVLSVERLNKIRDVDAAGGTLIAEAGVTLGDVQRAADNVGRRFPLSLASEDSARIGGVLATNAGGTATLAYGNARNLCLGLEAVMVDGRVWHGLTRLKKDNTGYDIRDLLIGSEGTLGIITAAALKMVAKPQHVATAIVGAKTPEEILSLFRLCEAHAGPSLSAFEFWSRGVEEFALRYADGTRAPFASPHAWSALIEISSWDIGANADLPLQRMLNDSLEKGLIADAAIAMSDAHRADFWRLRDAFSDAQKGAGGSIKHDVSVPVAKIPEFLERAHRIVDRICPGARPVPFGHFGDGNVHYNVSQPPGMEKTSYLAHWPEMTEAVHDVVLALGGSISAEHGIGQLKRAALVRAKSGVELDLMRAIKQALDPNGILNPGKVL